jgi:hypothetical protein
MLKFCWSISHLEEKSYKITVVSRVKHLFFENCNPQKNANYSIDDVFGFGTVTKIIVVETV